MRCPLCYSPALTLFCRDRRRDYLRCRHCALVHVPSHFWLTPDAERAEYDKHENDPNDAGYRRFLSRLSTPLSAMLHERSGGLDFGCGPGPTLSVMLEEAGHRMALYDKFYYRNESVWDTQYDFICATEVVEHLAQPQVVLRYLWSHLQAQGLFGVMTKVVTSQQAFSRWHYKNDPTHIVFFSVESFAWLARFWRAECVQVAADVFILKKTFNSKVV